MGLLNLGLLPQLIQEKGFLPDLDVVAEEECNRELKKDKKISSHSKALFFYPQTPDAESGVAEDENINVIFIHEEAVVPFFEASCQSCTVTVQDTPQAGLERPLPVKIELKNQTFSRLKGLHSSLKALARSSDQMRNKFP